ncbi:alpha-2-macroglobulin family protein [Propionivibrio soli]|uniref:alpha-2-macroglobulin family protein n=1 Tax=Propionivibrio soli TaxID=2976531 RepID=UPI0021E9A78A|nr:Ig-like domain-containing alpha-2-macroglobulin family protein [Propionivibrio soli]
MPSGFCGGLRLLFTIIFGAAAVASSHAEGIRQFTPQGVVDRQVRATAVFTSEMVLLGQSDALPPFDVDCGVVKGKGRWTDGRSWSFVLERPLVPGERCDFRLKSGLKTRGGEAVASPASYAFFAPGPWPRSLTPRPGAAIEEDQAFLIEASGTLKRASVESNVWCEADGIGNRIPVRVEPEATRDAVAASMHREVKPGTLLLSCAERLPAGAKMRLVWGKGVESDSGARTSRGESFTYTVREPFRATFTCEREKPTAPCSPLSDLRIQFSAPVDATRVAGARLITAEGSRSPAASGGESGQPNTVSEVMFAKPLPQNAELRIELPAGLKDETGRALENAASFPLRIRIGTLPPLAKFQGAFGILELKEGGVLPVALRHVEARLPVGNLRLPAADAHRFSDQRLTDDGNVIAAINALERFEQQTRKVKVGQGKEQYEAEDPYYARELPFLQGKSGVERRELPAPREGDAWKETEVVGVPLAKPGFHIVEIESRLLGEALLASPRPMYVRASALVTNMAVHLKRGNDNGLVWVTTLDTGKPVAGAEVRVSDCGGKSLWQGRTDAQGRALVDVALPVPDCRGTSYLFASARLGEDYSFVRSDWNEGIESWRFGVETWGEAEPRKIHTVFDRSLLRAGQIVSMKHIARERTSRGFAFPEPGALPGQMIIRHAGSGDEFRQAVTWDRRGVATSQWTIPASAKRGVYTVELAAANEAKGRDVGGAVESGSFTVSDFRLPAFTGSVQGVPDRLIAPKDIPLALGLSFLNGGVAKGAKVEVSATLRPRWPEYKGYDGFQFTVDFDSEGRSAFAVDDGREREQLVANRLPVTLDQTGAGKLSVALPARIKGPSELYTEMTFADPTGEVQTIHGSVELAPSGFVAGIRVKDWASVRDKGAVELLVLDTAGKPVADAPIKLAAKRRIDYSHRKRIVGGFYAYEHHSEFKDIGEICRGRTDARGKFVCTVESSEAGNVYLLAETQDAAGNVAYAGTSYWVAGSGDLWFTAGNQDRIDVIPEKHGYAPGETARLQVRTPFREATALVSIEAGGIIETHVRRLSRFKPVIELPIKGEWGPNVFVSVLAVRGRVEPLKWYSFFSWGWREPVAWFREWWNPAQPTAMVDLAKPAYKIGLASLDIGIDAFKLKVEVSPEKTVYVPRDKMRVGLRVTQPDGKPVPAGTEIAFAGVDQALLELRPNESWNLLEAMLPRRAYAVETATAQSQVVGKRHFGKKAVPPGGGGGRAPARELFDTLLLWNPRVALDDTGRATIDVPLNDALSEFKLVAVADAGAGLFGTGAASVRTRQDVQLISGLPPLVREKDRFSALLTLRNGTARAITVAVSAQAGGRALETREVKLAAESAAELTWPVEAPEGETSLAWEFEAVEKGGAGKDRLRVVQQVAPAVPVTVQQATFARVDGKLETGVAVPPGAVTGKSGGGTGAVARGGIEVSLSSRLSAPPPGLRRFFADYPFVCLEQKASVAIGLHDEARWRQLVEALPTYLDANGLARYFPGDDVDGSPVLTAYLLSATQAAGFVLPPDTAQRMERGLAAFAEGRIKPAHWSPQADLVVRKLAAIEALTRRGHAPASAVSSLEIEPARLPTSALIDWYLIAKRMEKLPQRAAKLAAVEREIRNRLSYLGGRLVFTSERSDYWWWLMVNGDANAFRLIEAVIDDPAWKEDLPAVLQGAMLRQQRGRWLTTVANVWATIALDRFGHSFEADEVNGTTSVALGPTPIQNFAWPTKAEPESANRVLVPWPANAAAANAQTLSVAHAGEGKPWAAIQVLAAVAVKEARSNGFSVKREVFPVQEKVPGKASRGDVWRVRLTVDSEQEMSWVVVNDPIPSGARILGEGDGRDSRIATMPGSEEPGTKRAERPENHAWPAYVERTFDAFRAYYSYVPRGKFTVEYTVRLSNAGEFALPATRAEAMYAPEVFGEVPNKAIVVSE